MLRIFQSIKEFFQMDETEHLYMMGFVPPDMLYQHLMIKISTNQEFINSVKTGATKEKKLNIIMKIVPKFKKLNSTQMEGVYLDSLDNYNCKNPKRRRYKIKKRCK